MPTRVAEGTDGGYQPLDAPRELEPLRRRPTRGRLRWQRWRWALLALLPLQCLGWGFTDGLVHAVNRDVWVPLGLLTVPVVMVGLRLARAVRRRRTHRHHLD